MMAVKSFSLFSLINVLFFINTQAQQIMYGKSDIRGSRYCEILVVKGKITNLTATVYNTLGCNDCPGDQWNSIDVKKLKTSMGARSIVMNGPRVFIMDKIGQSNTPQQKVNLGGMEMVERATLPISLKKLLSGKSAPYRENTVKRSTEYVFEKGKNVYELISPKHTYVMQSYSLQIDSTLNEATLNTLATKLKLPGGWNFKAVTLNEDLVLKTIEGGKAYVIQDDLLNSYQRVQ